MLIVSTSCWVKVCHCMPACQHQVAWRPVFILLASVCTVHSHARTYTYTYTQTHTHTLHTWTAKTILDMTHTEQTGNGVIMSPEGRGPLSIFIYLCFLSLCHFFNVPSLFPAGLFSNPSFFFKFSLQLNLRSVSVSVFASKSLQIGRRFVESTALAKSQQMMWKTELFHPSLC